MFLLHKIHQKEPMDNDTSMAEFTTPKNTETLPDHPGPWKHNLLLISSILICTIIVTTATLITKYCVNKTGKTSSSATIIAERTETPSEEIDSTLWYGNYSGELDNSLLTIVKSEGANFKFSLQASRGSVSDKIEGNASITNADSARYEDKNGYILLFTLNRGIVTIEKGSTNADPHPLSFSGDYINIDGNSDCRKNNYFAKPRTFGSDSTYKFDLNNDGTPDAITYKSGILTINKDTYKFKEDLENLDTEHFHIVDINTEDKYLNILIMDDGRSQDPDTTVITYTTDHKFKVSTIGCNIKYLQFDTKGVISGYFRFDILETWYGECKWNYNTKTNKVNMIKQDYYTPMELYNYNKAPVTLIEPIKIYCNADLESAVITLRPQEVKFLKTDNVHWVQVVGMKDDTTGWIYIKDFNHIPNEYKDANEVFANLHT